MWNVHSGCFSPIISCLFFHPVNFFSRDCFTWFSYLHASRCFKVFIHFHTWSYNTILSFSLFSCDCFKIHWLSQMNIWFMNHDSFFTFESFIDSYKIHYFHIELLHIIFHIIVSQFIITLHVTVSCAHFHMLKKNIFKKCIHTRFIYFHIFLTICLFSYLWHKVCCTFSVFCSNFLLKCTNLPFVLIFSHSIFNFTHFQKGPFSPLGLNCCWDSQPVWSFTSSHHSSS